MKKALRLFSPAERAAERGLIPADPRTQAQRAAARGRYGSEARPSVPCADRASNAIQRNDKRCRKETRKSETVRALTEYTIKNRPSYTA